MRDLHITIKGFIIVHGFFLRAPTYAFLILFYVDLEDASKSRGHFGWGMNIFLVDDRFINQVSTRMLL